MIYHFCYHSHNLSCGLTTHKLFTVLGHFAHMQGKDLDDYQSVLNGYSLAFISFPLSMNYLPSPHFFAFLVRDVIKEMNSTD